MLARGQVYIGLIISMAILAILSQAIITLVFSSYDLLNFTAARTTARYLAQSKMENIRNLPYDSVGTVGGIPTGTLVQFENIDRNGLNYEVRTSVIYVDDPFDQTAPADLLPTDYKRVRVEVAWKGLADSGKNPVVLVSDVAPRDIEEAAGGGTLSIFVIDASGNPLSNATAHIVAPTTPAIDLTLNTGATGRIVLPGAPACNSCYRITVSRTGYSSERTYAVSEVSNPAKPHQSIIQGTLTEISFAIDRVSTLNLATTSNRAASFAPLGGQSVRVHGEKVIGTDAQDDAVYKFDQVVVTNGSGVYTMSDVEWDTYHIIPTNTSYDTAGVNPLLPLSVIPNTTVDAKLAFEANTTHTLLATFADSGETQIASVTAQLKNSSGIYIATASSGLQTDPDWGQVFFPSLTSGNYTLEATASGYANSSTSINIVGPIQEIITLLTQ
jgi:hypothetical protein